MKRMLAMLLVVVCLLCACGSPAKAILGTWKLETTVLGVTTETVYQFNEDGTGSRKIVLVEADFTYEINDDQLILTFNTLGIVTTETYSYAFDGDTMTLTGNGTSITLTKQE